MEQVGEESFSLIEDTMREEHIPSDQEPVWLKYGNDLV
jgi:hypothetical protein